jgi:hypothetical protein
MKKLAIWTTLLVMAISLSACARPHMVKCPHCGGTFDATQHGIDIESGGN